MVVFVVVASGEVAQRCGADVGLKAADHVFEEVGGDAGGRRNGISAGALQTVAGIARNLGANRQNVQRIVNDLQRMEFLSFETNPRHRRAQLVVLTARGKQAYEAAMALQAPWVNQVTHGLDLKDLEAFQRVLLSLRGRLENGIRKSDDQEPETPGKKMGWPA